MNAVRHYTVEMVVEASGDPKRKDVRISLHDRQRQPLPNPIAGDADLDLSRRSFSYGGVEVPAEDFLRRFLKGTAQGAEEGMAFGRLLFGMLFEDPRLRAHWNELHARRAGAPLRVVLVLPKEAPWLADIPFELLCDDDGFVFFRDHHMVRTGAGLQSKVAQLRKGKSTLVAWANPRNEDSELIPASVLDEHERVIEEAAQAFGWTALPACRNATLTSLRKQLEDAKQAGRPVQVLSLVAHGDDLGGAVYLALEGDPSVGRAISAADLGMMLRETGVELVFLWICYGSRRHPVSGSVAERLLHPEYGDLAAVIASPAALRTVGTAKLAQRFMESLRNTGSEGIEYALAEARRELGEEDLQWAAPALYARPLRDQSVVLEAEAAVRQIMQSLSVAAAQAVEGAPLLSPHFRGREQERREGLELLRSYRLVSIVGMPGIGKTELSLAIAEVARQDEALGMERVVWIALDGMTSIEALRAGVAGAFDLKPDEIRSDHDLAKHLRGTRALIVLDNTEDLLRDATKIGQVQALLEALLRGAPGVRVLSSSRKPLGALPSAMERVKRIDRLEADAAREIFVSVVQGRLSQEDLAPGEIQRVIEGMKASEELAGLLEVLDGHPLSLVLVAGQVTSKTNLQNLRERIKRDADAIRAEELLDVDPEGSADSVLRLKRLVSSLNLSFLPLAKHNVAAAELFTWLGQLPAGLLEALVPVIFGERVREALGALRRAYLVHDVGERVRLLAPIQRYALRKLPEVVGEERRGELLARTLAAFGVSLKAMRERLGRAGAGEAQRLAVVEESNLAALITVVEEEELSKPLAKGLSEVLTHFAQLMLHAERAKASIELCARMARLVRETPGEANALHAMGALYVRTERLREAQESYGKALSLYREIEDRQGEANALKAMGDLYVRTARLRDAEETYRKALALYRELEDRQGEANALKVVGDLYVRTGRLREAEDAYGKALPLYQKIEARLGEANVLCVMGNLYVRTARLREAEEAYKKALPLYREIEARLGEANALRSMGELYLRTDRLREAEEAYGKALLAYGEIDARQGEANTRCAMGDLYVRTARLRDAEEAYGKALQLYREIEERLGEANALNALGNLYARMARLREAEQAYEQALPLYREIEERLGEANTLQAIGRLYARTARLKDAEEAYGKALPLYREMEERLGEANTLKAIGDLYAKTARLSEAEEAYGKALPLYRKIEARLGEANALEAMGNLYVRTARLGEAEEAYESALSLYQKIEDSLGEANVFQSLGQLMLTRGRGPAAFSLFLKALEIHQVVDSKLGVAGDHGYLSRAARVAGRPERAAVLASLAYSLLEQVDDKAGQIQALDELAGALATLEDERCVAPSILAWALAQEIEDPSGEARASFLSSFLDGFDSREALRSDAVVDLKDAVAGAVKDCEARLAASGEDLYSPLEDK